MTESDPFHFHKRIIQRREYNAWKKGEKIKEVGSSDILLISFEVVLPLSLRWAHFHSQTTLWSRPIASKESHSHPFQLKLEEFLLGWLIRSMVHILLISFQMGVPPHPLCSLQYIDRHWEFSKSLNSGSFSHSNCFYSSFLSSCVLL